MQTCYQSSYLTTGKKVNEHTILNWSLNLNQLVPNRQNN